MLSPKQIYKPNIQMDLKNQMDLNNQMDVRN